MQFTPESIWHWKIFVIFVSAMLTANLILADTDICLTGVIPLPEKNSTRASQIPNPPANIIADSIESPEQGLLTLRGNVQLRQGGRTLLADKMLYRKSTKLFEAHSNVRVYSRNGDILTTDFLVLNLDTKEGHTAKAKFKVADRARALDSHRLAYVAAYGTANKVVFNDQQQLQLLDVEYVNCLENKGDILASAKILNLNVDTGKMHAEKVKVRILNPNEHAGLID